MVHLPLSFRKQPADRGAKRHVVHLPEVAESNATALVQEHQAGGSAQREGVHRLRDVVELADLIDADRKVQAVLADEHLQGLVVHDLVVLEYDRARRRLQVRL